MSNSLKALHATLREAGLTDEDAKRDLYYRITGKRSAKDMSDAERMAVTAELKRLYPALKKASRRADGRSKLTGKYAGKLQALWIAGWNLGVFKNRDDAALIKFVERQTGISHVRFLRYDSDAAKVIEALKAILAREGGVDWSVDALTPDYARAYGYKIAKAQGRLLNDIYAVSSECEKALNAKPPYTGARLAEAMSDGKWIVVMNALGERIRAAKAKSEAA